MTFQDRVWVISLIFMSLVALIFIFTASQAHLPATAGGPPHGHRLSGRVRIVAFSAFILVFAVVSWVTLWKFPIPEQSNAANPPISTQVVKVVGRQWSWQLSAHTLRENVPVEFRVTSADVNHDFAVYDPAGVLVAQVQAMPGYVNKLMHTFRQPGTYTVRCLEYCGLGHAAMVARFRVTASVVTARSNGSDAT